MAEGHDDRRGGRCVRAGGIDKHTHPHRPEEGGPHGGGHGLSGGNVGAPHEDCGACQISSAASEHRPVHERHDRRRRHAPMPQEHFRSGIDGDDRIECARLGVAIELDQDSFRHWFGVGPAAPETKTP